MNLMSKCNIIDNRKKYLYSVENIKKILNQKGYKFFPTKYPYNLNIIGIRTYNQRVNKFDDILTLIYSDDTCIIHNDQFWITTDPGLYYLKHPINKKGTAIVVPGQYRGLWKIRKHNGKYLVLGQKNNVPVKVYRDRNKDNILDFDPSTIDECICGINLHHSNYYTESWNVDRWSAGCQVMKKIKDFNKVMRLAKKSSKIYGNSFTYTLLEERDFFSL